jgi:hypothetical protein
MIKSISLSKVEALTMLTILFTIGLLIIAIIDEKYRPTFSDLAKVCVGGYIGLLVPKK